MSSITSNVIKMSAAGSGKTFDICKNALDKVQSKNKVLITTYTKRGADSVKQQIRMQNDGVLHPQIVIKTWFAFLLSDLIKPYQRYLTKEIGGIKSIDYSETYGVINYASKGTKDRYITSKKNVRQNECSALALLLNQLSEGRVITRLEELYESIFIDEIQDLAGNDIGIIDLLINSSINIVCCGDNKQATFSTHNSRKNKNITGKNIWLFFNDLEKKGLISVEKNLASRRFNAEICSFANEIFPIGDSITTIMKKTTSHDGVFLIKTEDVNTYYDFYKPQILRYDKKTDVNGAQAINFGACKGETFERVMIIPNGPLKDFVLKGKVLSSPEKYYVAVTRPKYSIAIVIDKLPKALPGYEWQLINCGGVQIMSLKYHARI